MGSPVTLYRFQLELSDIDRGVYETLDFRAAQHPSETLLYLVTRVLAFALSYEKGLSFTSAGLSDPNEPALRSIDDNGETFTSIEIGNPSARRLHKTSKASKFVKIYTYKDPKLLLKEINSERIHRLEEIEIFSLDSKFLERIIAKLERQNNWQIIRNGESLIVNINGQSEKGDIKRHYF